MSAQMTERKNRFSPLSLRSMAGVNNIDTLSSEAASDRRSVCGRDSPGSAPSKLYPSGRARLPRETGGYPDELVVDEATACKVSGRWSEYFPEGGVDGVEDRLGYTGFALMD